MRFIMSDAGAIPVFIANQPSLPTATFGKRHPELASRGFNNYLIHDLGFAYFRYVDTCCYERNCATCTTLSKLAQEMFDSIPKSAN